MPVSTDILEVLISEEEKFALGSEQSKLIEALLGKLADLDARDLGTDVGVEVLQGSVSEEIRFRLIGTRSSIGVGKDLCGREFLVDVVVRK